MSTTSISRGASSNIFAAPLNGTGGGKLLYGSFEFDTGDRIVRVSARWISPDEARQMLALHSSNRRKSSLAVEAIRADIESDNWMFNGDTIGFATRSDGTVIGTDGQHRLEGIAKGDRHVPVLIVENLDPEVTDTIDQGRPRSVPDILKMTYELGHVKNVNVVTAMATTLLGKGKAGTITKNTRKMVAAFAAENIEALESFATWAANTCRDCQKFIHPKTGKEYPAMTAGPVGSLAYHMVEQGASYQLVVEFFQRIADGVVTETDRTNVIQAIRKRQRFGTGLTRMSLSAGPNASWHNTEFHVYINAFNRWVKGEYTSKIQSPKNAVRSFEDLPKVITDQKKAW